MKASLLLPHRYRMYGWIIFIPILTLGLANYYNQFEFRFLDFRLSFYPSDSPFGGEGGYKGNFTDEIAALGLIISLMMIGFSKEKIEDEQISRLRLDSLQWSIYVNYLVLALAIVFIHGGYFFSAMVYNMFTPLVFFIIRFRWAIYMENKLLINQGGHEE